MNSCTYIFKNFTKVISSFLSLGSFYENAIKNIIKNITYWLFNLFFVSISTFFMFQSAVQTRTIINMLHHSNEQYSFKNSIMFYPINSLSTWIGTFAICFVFCTSFFLIWLFAVHLELLVILKSKEVGLLESENQDLPLLHRQAQECHKRHYP